MSLTLFQSLNVMALCIPMPCGEHDANANLLLHCSFELKRCALREMRRVYKKAQYPNQECLQLLNTAIRNTNLGHHIQWYLEQILQMSYAPFEVEIQCDWLQKQYKWEIGVAP